MTNKSKCCGAYAAHWKELGKPEGWTGCNLPKGHKGYHTEVGKPCSKQEKVEENSEYRVYPNGYHTEVGKPCSKQEKVEENSEYRVYPNGYHTEVGKPCSKQEKVEENSEYRVYPNSFEAVVNALKAYQEANPIHNDSESALYSQAENALSNRPYSPTLPSQLCKKCGGTGTYLDPNGRTAGDCPICRPYPHEVAFPSQELLLTEILHDIKLIRSFMDGAFSSDPDHSSDSMKLLLDLIDDLPAKLMAWRGK